MPDIKSLTKNLKVSFKNEAILEEALTHRSYINEHPKWKRQHNERLEFLGDAVLELIVTKYLFDKYPEHAEGDLTNLRAVLVRAETLAEIARELGVNDFILLSRGEAKDTGRAREAILADAFEAIVGAIYLDLGLSVCKDFIYRTVLAKLQEVLVSKGIRDPKSRFQELAQEKSGITPHYQVLKETGPDHARIFTVGAYLGDKLAGSGRGASKQEAQQNAAQEALKKQKWTR